MRTWTGNEVLELGQPPGKDENQSVKRFIECITAWGRELKVYQINKSIERREEAQYRCCVKR